MTENADLQQAETPLSDHVARFWRILKTEACVRILVDMQRGSGGMPYFDSANFPDQVAKALVEDRNQLAADLAAARKEIEGLREALHLILPEPLDWRESGDGVLTVTMRKEDLRRARAALSRKGGE